VEQARGACHLPPPFPPTTKFAPLLPRGAVIAGIDLPHRLVTSVAQRGGHAWQTVGMTSHLPVALVGARMVEQPARGVGQGPPA
jgi:hypothetical protein